MGDKTAQILRFSGSLRKGSYNTAMLPTAGERLRESMTLYTFYLPALPMFNEDAEKFFPAAVEKSLTWLAADGVLIAYPEYNSSLTGALKNALDWALREPKPRLKAGGKEGCQHRQFWHGAGAVITAPGADIKHHTAAGQAGSAGGAGRAGFERIGGTCGRCGGWLIGRPAENLYGLDKVGLGGVAPRRA